MDSYDEYYKCTCRICLTCKRNEKMVSLTDKNSKEGLSCYGKAVQMFANISISKNDELPKSMCISCLSMLKQAIHFKMKCELSDKNLSILYHQHIESGSNLQEMVVDFSLFTEYFPQTVANIQSTNCSEGKSICLTKEHSQVCEIDEDSIHDNEDNIDKIQGDTDMDSADELLDLLEKNISRLSNFSKNAYNRICKRKIKPKREINRKFLPHRIKDRRPSNKASKNEKYICNVCQKELATQHTLKYHMQRHNGFNFICEHCGKGFPIMDYLQMHLVSRHGTGPYFQCPHCPYKAPRSFVLKEHIRLHTGERPYTCDKCGLTFRRRAIWTKHMIYHKEKTVQCPHCPRKFYREVEMRAHSNGVHERMYVFLCHKCNTTYAKTETVRRHLTEKHGIPREMQGKIIRINKEKSAGFPEQ